MSQNDKRNLNPQFFSKHILPSFVLLKEAEWSRIDFKVEEEIDEMGEEGNDYQRVAQSNNVKFFQIKQDKKVNIPDLYLLKSQLNHFLSIINSLPQNHVELVDQIKKSRERFQFLESSVPPTQKKDHEEYQSLNKKLLPVQQMGKAILFFLHQKNEYIENYKKGLKKEKQKFKLKKDKDLLKEWEAQIDQYHDLFPVARRLRRKVKLFIGPTNSGKTYNALNELTKYDKGVYLAPLRLLALEGKEELESRNRPCSFITGEEKEIVEGAHFTAQTIETFNFHKVVDAVLIDEVQMIADYNRGWAWSQALIGAPAENIILTGSLDCRQIIQYVCELLGDELEIVELNRFTNLEVAEEPEDIAGEKIKNLEESTALIVFSRKSVLKFKYYFEQAGLPVSIIYGNLSPEVRREEAKKFRSGETKYLISTDAIAMGLNLPIKKVIFAEVQKFNGQDVDFIQPNEVRQIAGRAGRYGKFDVGFVSALNAKDLNFIKKTITVPNKIEKTLYVRPSIDQVIFLSQLINEEKLSVILDKFYKLIQKQEDVYKSADLEQIKILAQILDLTKLSLEDKYFWSTLPIDTGTPECLEIFKNWVKAFSEKKSIKINLPFYIPDVKTKQFNQDFLYKAEISVKILTAYAWLVQHFPNIAVDAGKCKQMKAQFNEYIIDCLNSSISEKRCPDCNKVLSVEHPHKKCDECFFQNRNAVYTR